MRLLVAVLVLLIFALLAEAAVAGRPGIPRVVHRIASSGIPFILIGILLGPNLLGLLDRQAQDDLRPLLLLGLGAIGFLYGIHLEGRHLRLFPAGLYLLALGEATITLGLVLALAWAFMALTASPALLVWPVALVLASASAGTAPAPIFELGQNGRLSGQSYELIQFISALDDLPGLLAIGILSCVIRTPEALLALATIGTALLWFLASLALGVVCGFLMMALWRLGLDDQALGLIILGGVGLVSGLCAIINLNPLFVGLVAGATLANLSRLKEPFYRALAQREHTVYVIFLILLGAALRLESVYPLWLAFFCLAARAIGKVLGLAATARALGLGLPQRAGLALMPQGGMAVAIVASTQVTFLEPLTAIATPAVIFCVMVSGLMGPEIAYRALSGPGQGDNP